MTLARTAALVGATLVAGMAVVDLTAAPVADLRGQLRHGVPWSALPLDLLVAASAAGALLCCATWLTVVVLATAVEVGAEALVGVSLGVVRAVTPAVVRRVVALCCGVAVGGSSLAAPALAQADRAGSDPAGTTPAASTGPGDLLAGLPLPDRAQGSGRAPSRARGEPPRHGEDVTVAPRVLLVGASATTSTPERAHERRGPRLHTVRSGESLWSIAADLLPQAGPARLDAAWRLIRRANRHTLGSDPDLIIPGTTLRLPSSVRSEGPTPHAAEHRKDLS